MKEGLSEWPMIESFQKKGRNLGTVLHNWAKIVFHTHYKECPGKQSRCFLGGTTMKKVFIIASFIGFVVMASSVSAQEYAEKTEYSFDDDVVTGDLVRPDGEITVVRKRGKERSLIRVRQHFIPEMLKSVEDL